MSISNESMAKANELWRAMTGHIDPNIEEANKVMLIGFIGRFIEDAWQQGFSDCEMMQRIERMRNNK